MLAKEDTYVCMHGNRAQIQKVSVIKPRNFASWKLRENEGLCLIL